LMIDLITFVHCMDPCVRVHVCVSLLSNFWPLVIQCMLVLK